MKLTALTSLALVIAALALPGAHADNFGSYLGHAGGPGTAGPVTAPATARVPNGGFEWVDAGVGAGFASGIALVTSGVWLASRRRRELRRPQAQQPRSSGRLTGDPDDRRDTGTGEAIMPGGSGCLYMFAVAVAALAFFTTAGALAAGGSAPLGGSQTCEEGAERASACELVRDYFRAINTERYQHACAMLGDRLLFESGGPECPRFLAFAGRQHFVILTAERPVAGRVDVIVALELRELDHFRVLEWRAVIGFEGGALKIFDTSRLS